MAEPPLRAPSSLLGFVVGLRKSVLVVVVVLLGLGLYGYMSLSLSGSGTTRETPERTHAPRANQSSVKGVREEEARYRAEPWPAMPPAPAPVVEASPPPPAIDLEALKQDIQRSLQGEHEATKALLLAKIQELEGALAARPVDPPARPLPSVAVPPAPPPPQESAEDRRKRLEAEKKAEEARVQALKAWKPARYVAPTPKTTTASRLAPYTLTPGHVIPVTLYTAMTSKAPGDVVLMVREAVYDSATGRSLLIPQDTRITCDPAEVAKVGATRLKPACSSMTIPGRPPIDLKGLPLADHGGAGGAQDRHQAHWGRLILFSVLTGISGSTRGLAGYSADPVSRVGGNIVNEGSHESTQQIRQLIDTSPTLEVRPGWRGNLVVRDVIEFPEPYRP